jgi:hypothetical protein
VFGDPLYKSRDIGAVELLIFEAAPFLLQAGKCLEGDADRVSPEIIESVPRYQDELLLFLKRVLRSLVVSLLLIVVAIRLRLFGFELRASIVLFPCDLFLDLHSVDELAWPSTLPWVRATSANHPVSRLCQFNNVLVGSWGLAEFTTTQRAKSAVRIGRVALVMVNDVGEKPHGVCGCYSRDGRFVPRLSCGFGHREEDNLRA